jgi:hypothetical protein
VRPQGFFDDLSSIAQVAVPIAISLLQARPQLPQGMAPVYR